MEDLLFWDAKVYKMYLYNASTSLRCMMSIGFGKLAHILKKRTVIVDNIVTSELFSHTRRSQVEKRFGGDQSNLTGGFWPPTVPNCEF